MKVIAVDFDGTLSLENGNANRTLINKLDVYWHTKDVLIIVYTARPEEYRGFITTWLKDQRVPYHAVVCDKMPADIYIEDKSITSEQFVLEEEER